jgi:hypothetical protein
MNVKLKNGEDLIAQLMEDHTNTSYIKLKEPVKLISDINIGIYAKNWMFYSKSNSITLEKTDIFFINDASEESIEWYMDYLSKKESFDESDDSIDDLETMFNALKDSKNSIKH